MNIASRLFSSISEYFHPTIETTLYNGKMYTNEQLFSLVTTSDADLINGTSDSINGALFCDKEKLLEYIDYSFSDRDDANLLLKFVEKFYENIKEMFEQYQYICFVLEHDRADLESAFPNDELELLLIINVDQEDTIEHDWGVSKKRSFLNLCRIILIIKPDMLKDHVLKYEKQRFKPIKGAHNLA